MMIALFLYYYLFSLSIYVSIHPSFYLFNYFFIYRFILLFHYFSTPSSYRYDIATAAWLIETEDQDTANTSSDPGSSPRIDSNTDDLYDGKHR